MDIKGEAFAFLFCFADISELLFRRWFFSPILLSFQNYSLSLPCRSEKWTITLRRAIKLWPVWESAKFNVNGWKVWKLLLLQQHIYCSLPVWSQLTYIPAGVSWFHSYLYRYCRTFWLRMSRRLTLFVVTRQESLPHLKPKKVNKEKSIYLLNLLFLWQSKIYLWWYWR